MNTLLLTLALGAISTSKLGPYALADPNDGSLTQVIDACPRIAHWRVPDSAVAHQIDNYKALCPTGIVVLSVIVNPPVTYDTTMDPTTSAQDYWNRMTGNLAGITSTQVSWLEGPNEDEVLPGWGQDLAKAAWYGDFWAQLAGHINNAGYHPLVGSIGAGQPALAGALGPSSPNAFKPIADKLKASGLSWGWSYHAFSTDLTKDLAIESQQSLRYRQIRDQCQLAGIPIVLSEAGQATPGWLKRGTTAQAYLDWLTWFDQRLHEDTEVQGATLFQFGDRTTFAKFDLSSLAASFAAYLTNPGATCDGGPCGAPKDGGSSSSGSGGSLGGGSGGQASEVDTGAPNRCGCQSASAPALLAAALLALPLAGNRLRRRAS